MRIPAILGRGALLLALLAPPALLHAQDQAKGGPVAQGPPEARTPSRPVLPAIRIHGIAPTIDGILDDEVWSQAPLASDFIQIEPQEGAPSTERTEVRVLYGEGALYVAFRAFDSEPDSIAAQLTRRDTDSYSDAVHVVIDSYHDRRTAFHFGVNPKGVKMDLYRFNDTEEDASWDAVWDVGTHIDDQGWTAEFRIPYSQLRFGNHDNQTWGINFAREIARRNETSTWAPIRNDDAAIVSKSGELQGLRGLGSPTRLELRPFTLARLTRAPGEDANPFYQSSDFFSSAGVDVKYGVTNDLTLDITVNPDFGQVEADPAQVNLTAYETFYPERRPFFIEGAAIYSFGIGVGDGDGGQESLFYSRRIGRAPQGWADPQGGFVDTPDATTILGATKLSGKTRNGWSIGLLHALTTEESAQVATGGGDRLEEAVEPLTNYGVARLQKDFRDGLSAVGFIGTGVKRSGEVADDLRLRTGAYTGGLDFRHRFGADNRYEMSGYVLGSHVRGSREAMALTQLSPARYFQRPDADHVEYDPDRTSLNGWAGNVQFMKIGEGYWNWGTILNAKSPGFEPNDLGYQRESDLILHVGFLGYNHYNPTEHLRSWRLGTNVWHGWSFGGERLATGGNINGAFTLPNYWGGQGGINVDLEAFSNSTLRGGPLLRREGRVNGWFGVFSDSRKAVRFNLNSNWARGVESGSWSAVVAANLRWRPSGRADLTLGPFFSRNLNDLQWVRRFSLDESHYLFGRIDQKTLGLTGRLDFTFMPDLTLQVYAQPFVSAGSYSAFKQLGEPRARKYEERFVGVEASLADGTYSADLDGDGNAESFGNPDFNFKQFRSTMVLRWEYRPGSLLYLVWSQGRNHYGDMGQLNFGESLGDLFAQRGENVFMVKLSYWITP